MPNPAVAIVGSTFASTAVQSSSARRAASAQQRAASQAAGTQQEALRSFERRTQPFAATGLAAANPLLNLLGISPPGQQQLAQVGPDINALNAELASIDSQIAQAQGAGQGAGGRVFGGALGQAVQGLTPQLQERRQAIIDQISQAEAAQDQFAQPQTGQPPLADAQTLAQVNPLVDFLRQEGFEDIQESAAAQGGLRSGGTLRDLARFNTQLASTVVPQLQQQRFNQLFNLLGLGSNVTAGQGTAGLQTAGNIGNLLQAGGAARAGGILGQGQAFQQGIGDLAFIGGARQGGAFNQPTGGFNFLNNPNTGGAVVDPNRFRGVS